MFQFIIDKPAQWFKSRYKLDEFTHLITEKKVPVHKHSFWYYLGGTTLILFITQIITGILLLFYYKPTAERAFESVKFIMTKVEFGWLIRSIHSWSANLMVAAAFIHLFSVFFLRSYRRPRELTWVTGAFLFFLCLGFGFTGYLLPWNTLAFFATKVGSQIAGTVPFLGEYIRTILRGGEEVTDATLGRFFSFHVIILPLVTLAVLGLHLFMVQIQGMGEPISEENKPNKKYIPFLPDFLLRDAVAWVLMLGLLTTLSVYFPWELGAKADPFASAPAGIKPEWYFMFMFQTLKFIPSKIFAFDGEVLGILAFGFAGFLMVMVPFWDIWARRSKANWFVTLLGIFAVIYIITLTVLGYVLPAK